MSELVIPHFAEQRLACRSLVLTAKNTSKEMDKFVQWMLAGFGAGLTYLLGQSHISPASLKNASLVYLAAALIGVLQRYVAMIVKNGTSLYMKTEKTSESGETIDLARFFIIYLDAMSGFQRWAAAWSVARFLKGDLIAVGKGMFKLAYAQCFLGMVCTGLLITAFYLVLDGFRWKP